MVENAVEARKQSLEQLQELCRDPDRIACHTHEPMVSIQSDQDFARRPVLLHEEVTRSAPIFHELTSLTN